MKEPFRNMLKGSNIGKFLIAESFSLIGSAMIPVVLSFSVYAMGGGEETVSIILAVQTVPFIFLLPISGAIIARCTAIRVLIFSEVICFISELCIAFYFSYTRLDIIPILILCLILGAGASFVIPSGETLVAELVDSKHLHKINSIIGIIAALGAMIGPTLGGIVISNMGPQWAILIDAITYAISIYFLTRIPPDRCKPAHPEKFLTLVMEGWKEFRAQSWLRVMVGVYAGFHLLVLGPAYVIASSALTHIEFGAERWGLLLGILAAGHIGGGLLSIKLNSRNPLILALFNFGLFSLAPAAIAASNSLIIQAPAFFISGMGLAIFSVIWETTKQRVILPHMLSRVSAIATLGSASLLPLGYLISTPLTHWLGNRGALLFTSVCCISLSIFGLSFPSVRGIKFPSLLSSKVRK